jgi:hypothetical protein
MSFLYLPFLWSGWLFRSRSRQIGIGFFSSNPLTRRRVFPLRLGPRWDTLANSANLHTPQYAKLWVQ